MKSKRQVSANTLIKRREAWLRKLAQVGPFMRGSLVTAKRGNHLAHQLTVSVKGKTHTVYVPIDMVEEVREWTKNYRRAPKRIPGLLHPATHCALHHPADPARKSHPVPG